MSTPPSLQPTTKIARQSRVGSILSTRTVRSQAELAALLADEGLAVTQATLSRDLVELGAVRVRAADGGLVYAVRQEGGDRSPRAGVSPEIHDAKLAKQCAELLITAEASGNMVVLRTPPGAANFLALSIDHSTMPQILGCIAGDDTVMLVTREVDGGAEVAARFLALADPQQQ